MCPVQNAGSPVRNAVTLLMTSSSQAAVSAYIAARTWHLRKETPVHLDGGWTSLWAEAKDQPCSEGPLEGAAYHGVCIARLNWQKENKPANCHPANRLCELPIDRLIEHCRQLERARCAFLALLGSAMRARPALMPCRWRWPLTHGGAQWVPHLSWEAPESDRTVDGRRYVGSDRGKKHQASEERKRAQERQDGMWPSEMYYKVY